MTAEASPDQLKTTRKQRKMSAAAKKAVSKRMKGIGRRGREPRGRWCGAGPTNLMRVLNQGRDESRLALAPLLHTGLVIP